MEWFNTMNEAMNYIETHLDDHIDIRVLASMTHCSEFHFQRLFSTIVDVSLSEYIRRRRLTRAAEDLKQTSIRVMDCALKYGYESADAFTKAFKNFHKLTPTQAREEHSIIKAYPKISFMLHIKGGIELNYRFEKKEAFKVYGISKIIDHSDQLTQLIPQFWQEIQENGVYEKLCYVFNQQPYSNFSLSGAFYDDCINLEHQRKYLICSSLPLVNETFDGFEEYSISSGEWVVFTENYVDADDCTNKVQSLWKRVFRNGFLTHP